MPDVPYKILIVEDDVGLSKLIKMTLSDAGIKSKIANTGKDAISAIEEMEQFLVLLDYTLPDMNANEIISVLKSKSQSIPFLIMTGNDNEGIAGEMMKQGASGFLLKDAGIMDRIVGEIEGVLKTLP
ncbi:MAG: response regulator [bacterium]|nr:response regulator [bacterium]